MGRPAARSFTDADRAKVRAASAAAQARTSAALRTIVVTTSSRYERAAHLLGLFLAIAATIAFWLAGSDGLAPVHLLLPAQLAAYLLGAAGLGRLDGLRYRVAGRALMDRRVQFAAERCLGEHTSGERPAVVLYVSVFEKAVVVAADPAVAAKVRPEAWNEARDAALQGFREDQGAEGLCRALERLGAALAETFPAAAGA
ncbi:MAG: hypothetical protein M5U26_27935 [Planctomycetota bacterium]|nr:hypothetical protein [Planctomycetota bacterium]